MPDSTSHERENRSVRIDEYALGRYTLESGTGPARTGQQTEAAVAVLQHASDLDLFLLTTPDDTEDAPWMVMADLQVRETDLLMDILRLHVQQQGLPWYLASYLKITMPRPGSGRPLDAAPDLLMALAEDRPRISWNIGAEGQAPRFVLEVSSTSSWERDSVDKPLIYQAMGVWEYAVFAPERDDHGPVLFGYRWDAQKQAVPWAVDAQGVLWSRELDLGLYVEAGQWLRAVDRQGDRLPTPTERYRAEAAARTSETARREAAESEVARLQEELRRLRQQQD
jgi:Uma2 family endonuclease